MIDFKELKTRHNIVDVVTKMLGVQLKCTDEARGQYEGQCPMCSDRRAFKVNSQRNAFICFSGPCAKAHGDAIELVRLVNKLSSAPAAAEAIASHFGTVPSPSRAERPPVAAVARQPQFDPQAYLATLSLDGADQLGLTPETLKEFDCGFSTKPGINTGRLAMAIKDAGGNILGFVGRALKEETEFLRFPKSLQPEMLFNVDRIKPGVLYLVFDPVDVLKAYEGGEENVICSMVPLSPQQLDAISSFMQAKNCFELRVF